MKKQTVITTDAPGEASSIALLLENYYFKGIHDGDLIALQQVYFPGALVFGDVKGVPYFKTIDQYFEGVRNRKSPKETGTAFKGEIIAIDIVNSIAVAEVMVKMYDFHYHEFLSFHNMEGQWKIVNKMLTDITT